MKNPRKWVKDNYSWLIKWFDDCESVSKDEMSKAKTNDTHCQIFRDSLYKDQDYDKALREHIENILITCIWGKHFRVNTGNNIITGMDGFYKLRHRLPLPSDKVGIRYFGEDKLGIRMLRFDPNRDGSYPVGKFLSDCRLQISNN